MAILNSGVPNGELKDKWTQYKDSINLVNPANKRNIDVIVVGTGLAGGSASATLAELGYNVKTFCYHRCILSHKYQRIFRVFLVCSGPSVHQKHF